MYIIRLKKPQGKNDYAKKNDKYLPEMKIFFARNSLRLQIKLRFIKNENF